MKNLILLSIIFITSSAFAGTKSPKALPYLGDDNLSKLESLYLLNDGALLHSCGYISSKEYSKALSAEEIKSAVKELIISERPNTNDVTFEKSTADYDKLPYFSMGPGWPTGIDQEITEDLLDLGGRYLKNWAEEISPLKSENYTFSGQTIYAQEYAYDFFAIYDVYNNQLVVFGIDLKGESNQQYCK